MCRFPNTIARAGGKANASDIRLQTGRSSTSSSTNLLRLEDPHFRQREAVELARVGRGVGAGVADVDEVAFLEVGGQRLVAHHDVYRVAGRAADRPGNIRTRAVGPNLVLEALGRLDHAAEHAGIPVHPALAATRGGAKDAADEVAGVGNEVAPRLGDDLHVL